MRYDKNCSNHIGQKVKSEKFDFVILIPNDRNQCNEWNRMKLRWFWESGEFGCSQMMIKIE